MHHRTRGHAGAGTNRAGRYTTATETGRGGLQEIVVTATRREESLSKVPISVTALTQEDIDQRGIKDFQDLVRFTPGVTIDNSGTNAISIRGISSSGGAGTTGIYIDDTPIQMRSIGFNPDDTLPKTFDLQRVEVLRGPQGTLFGAGSEGGAVRYILTQPNTTTTDSYVRSELPTPSTASRTASSASRADSRSSMAPWAFAPVPGTARRRLDQPGRSGTYPATANVINHNVNYSNRSWAGSRRSGSPATSSRHAERPLSAPG